MTRNEAIFELIKYRRRLEEDPTIIFARGSFDAEPFDMAVEALEDNDKLAEDLQSCLEMYKKKKAEVKALERKHGEWIDGLDIPKEERERHPYVYLHGEKYCSVCYKEAYFDADYGQQLFDYCPNCGADMRGDEDE